MDPIAVRTSRLRQWLSGLSNAHTKSLVSKDGLLDSLLALYDESANDELKSNKNVQLFLKKYDVTVKELRKLRISIEDFEVRRVIGQGHFGEVQVARERSSGDVYALKVLRKADTLSQINSACYEEERDIMARAGSVWLTKLHFAFQDHQHLYLVMEYHPGGDLLSLLSRYEDVFEEAMAQFYLAEIVLAIHALHLMGYVHRDIKPENILLDRTGHVKLADFGSACKLHNKHAGFGNLPVGTPDYICPEVLLRMNSNRGDEDCQFDEACDWWSLGICAYEMLYGKTPFSDEAASMTTTYANIMSHQKKLSFPERDSVSRTAVEFIQALLVDFSKRLGYEAICVHPFFSKIDFHNIRHITPPFIPNVSSNDDTSNFDEFEKRTPKPNTRDFMSTATGFTGKDLPFVGFTFTKNLNEDARSGLCNELSSPVCTSSLERKLTMKSQELAATRHRVQQMENSQGNLNTEAGKMKWQCDEAERWRQRAEKERDDLEHELACVSAENKRLARALKTERQERLDVEEKAKAILDNIRSHQESLQAKLDENLGLQLQSHELSLQELRIERTQLRDKISQLETQLADMEASKRDQSQKLVEAEKQMLQVKDKSRKEVHEMSQKLASVKQRFDDDKLQLETCLEKAVEDRKLAEMEVAQTQEDLHRMEEKLAAASQEKDLNDTMYQDKLVDSEEKRLSLESRLCTVNRLKERVTQLQSEVSSKSSHVLQLADRVAELEGELSYIRTEQSVLEEKNLSAFEEREEQAKRIYQLEALVSKIECDNSSLRHQVSSLQTDLQEAADISFCISQMPNQTFLDSCSGDTTSSSAGEDLAVYRSKMPISIKSYSSEANELSPSKKARIHIKSGENGNINSKIKAEVAMPGGVTNRKSPRKTSQVSVSVKLSERYNTSCESNEDINWLARTKELATCETQTSFCDNRKSSSISTQDLSRADLVMRVAHLEEELAGSREACFNQRVRALDLKHDLREKTASLEKEVSEIQYKLQTAESALLAATESEIKMKERESGLREQVEKSQSALDTARLEARKANVALQETKSDLESQVQALEKQCDMLEKGHTNVCRERELLQSELKLLQEKVHKLEPKNEEMERSLRSAEEDRKRQKMLAESLTSQLSDKTESLTSQLSDKTVKCDTLSKSLTQTKELCCELESQITMLESLISSHEEKEAALMKEKQSSKKIIQEKSSSLAASERQLALEKQAKEKLEQRVENLSAMIESTRQALSAENDRIKTKLIWAENNNASLNKQLEASEKQLHLVEVDKKSIKRRLTATESDNIQLKEEISGVITKLAEVKSSNLQLSQELEDCEDQCDLLKSERQDILNQMEQLMAGHTHNKYQMESTIGQQGKLIDYLQDQVQNPPKKKKPLFGRAGGDVPGSAHIREAHISLEHEREKNATLRTKMLHLQGQLSQRTTTISRRDEGGNGEKYASTMDLVTSRPQTPLQHCKSMDNLSDNHTPRTLPLPPTRTPVTPRQSARKMHGSTHSIYGSSHSVHDSACTPRSSGRRPVRPISHNIPHRVVTGLNSKATQCCVCLGSIHFVKQAAKCQECNMVCHPHCLANLPATCGLPTEYASQFTNMMNRVRSISTRKISVADLKLRMTGWVKIPRPGNQIWERKWAELKDNKVFLYEYDNVDDLDPFDDFDLCPQNGEVTVHSAVTAAELQNTASSDLPYIMRLEFEPDTTCWPGRSIYLLSPTFTEKQRWVATMEAIVNTRPTSHNTEQAKVYGNTLAQLKPGQGPAEINCAVPFNDEVVLVGTDTSLYALQLHRTEDDQPLIKLEGLPQVHSIHTLPGLDIIVFIAGKERGLFYIDKASMGHCVSQGLHSSISRDALLPHAMSGISKVTTLAMGYCHKETLMCVATADSVLIMKYNLRSGMFSTVKELLIKQAVGCMYFGESSILFGSDRFHAINLRNFSVAELLDGRDPSLTFATYGAAQYNSFPIDILQVAPPGQPYEFLLCFHEFGVFVDEQGRRSRSDDLRWNGLPLSFAFEEPFLYVVYFNTLQVVRVPPKSLHAAVVDKCTVYMTRPRLLGPAMTAGAIYVSHNKEDALCITCYRGNLAVHAAAEEVYKENRDPCSIRDVKHASSRGKQQVSTSRRQPMEAGFGSASEEESESYSEEDEGHQFVMQTMSRSPPKRICPDSSSQSSSSDEESDKASTGRNIRTNTSVKIRAALLERRLHGNK